jgi:hypothetical protein
VSLNELLHAANELDELDLDVLVDQILLLRAQRKSSVLSEDETRLLLQINQGVPEEMHQQYRSLVVKRDAETLTDDEYETLSALSDRIEVLAAARAGALVQLANLRQIPLMQLMDNLGIQTPSYV